MSELGSNPAIYAASIICAIIIALIVCYSLFGIGYKGFIGAGKFDFTEILPISICPCFGDARTFVLVDISFD